MSDTDDLQELGDVETMLIAALAGVRKLFNRHAGSTMLLAYVSGDAQSGTVATNLSTIRVKVTLANGSTPVAGESVTLDSSSDGIATPTTGTAEHGSSPAVGVSDASGFVDFILTLPTQAGDVTVVAEHGRSGQRVSVTATATAGALSQLIYNSASNQSATTGLAVGAPPSVIGADTYGNPVAGATVSAAKSDASDAVSPASVVTGADGVATFTSWTMSVTAGAHTLTLSASGASDKVFTANAVAGSLPVAIAVQAGGSQTGNSAGGSSGTYTFRVTAAGGAGVPGVTVRFAAPAGGGSAPVNQVTDANGDVFPVYTLGQIVGLNTLNATFTDDSSVDHTATETQTTIAGPVAALRYVQQPPSNMNSGQTMAPQPAVELIDQYGNRKVSGTGQAATVTLSIVAGSDATLGGTVASAASAGLKTFTNVSLTDATGGNSTLRASASVSGVTYTIDSNTISASPPLPDHCVISTQPPSSVGQDQVFTMVVDVVDSFVVRIPGDTSTITVTLTNNTEGATLLNNGTSTLTAVCSGGRATFNLSVTGFTGNFTILAERGSDNAFDVTSNAFTVTAASTHPNEPAGYVERGFIHFTDDGTADGFTRFAASDPNGYSAVSVSGSGVDAADPFAGGFPTGSSGVGRARFVNPPLTTGHAPINIQKTITGQTGIYVDMYIGLSSPYVNETTGTKDCFIAATGAASNPVIFPFYAGTGLQLQCRLQGAPKNLGGNNASGAQNISCGLNIVRGQVYRLEAQFVMNSMNGSTPNEDGIFKCWVDGVSKINRSNMCYRGGTGSISGTGKFNLIKWNPTYGGGSTNPPSTAQYMYKDEWYTSGTP